MLILDYLRETVDDALIVPPFHTGHMGLIPQSDIYVTFASHRRHAPTHCEVMFTPYQPLSQDTARITCVMRERPGVVRRLIDAVSDLGVNILTQESSTINRLNEHMVEMIVDLADCDADLSHSTQESAARIYAHYQGQFPTNNNKYILLFESIIANCAAFLSWDSDTGLPQLKIRPIAINRPPPRDADKVIVQRHDPAKWHYHVEMTLPPVIVTKLRDKLAVPEGNLSYILVSDTEERALRAFFPEEKTISRLVHVGVYHDNLSGALTEILGIIADAEFNILTSLLRRDHDQRNVWEALLEYQGSEELPVLDQANLADSEKALCIWMKERMLEVLEVQGRSSHLDRYSLQIGMPRYPQRRRGWHDKVDIFPARRKAGHGQTMTKAGEESHSRKILDKIDDLLSEELDKTSVRLVRALEARLKSSPPKLFLSYPTIAAEHGSLVKEKLKDDFDIVEVQGPEGDDFVQEVLRKIKECSCFIGIWHHEEAPKGFVSPWMPFEYGIARALELKVVMVHSKSVDEKVWRRISPNLPNKEYTDISFQTETLGWIVREAKNSFGG